MIKIWIVSDGYKGDVDYYVVLAKDEVDAKAKYLLETGQDEGKFKGSLDVREIHGEVDYICCVESHG